MTKLRRQRRRKKFRYNVNRKRLRNKLRNPGGIGCKKIKDEWNKKFSVQRNLQEMGLSHDPNQTIKIPNYKQNLKIAESAAPIPTKATNDDWIEEQIELQPTKSHVAKQLEADAKEPREKLLRLPKNQVDHLTYLVEKYGNDYQAMVKDRRNYYQETWKQIRGKIRQLQKIPEQCPEIIRNLNDSAEDISDDEAKMIPVNVIPVFLKKENCDLFEFIFNCAENGCGIWVVVPEVINQLPKTLKTPPPPNEVLKLITFMYLKDYESLLKQFNGIHVWHKIPNIIIVTNFEQYLNINNDLKSAFMLTTLLDSASVCAKKKNSKILLVITLESDNVEALQNTLLELYLPYIAKTNQDLNNYLSIILER